MKFKNFKLYGLMLLVLSSAAYAEILSTNELINVSGKTRVTSQRLARTYIEQCLNAQNSPALNQVIHTMDNFWSEILEYSPVKADKASQNSTNNMYADWQNYKTLLKSECNKDVAKKVYDKSELFGANADNYVALLQKNLGKGVGAKLVNQAGRQRYYSMSIAKYIQAQQMGLVAVPDANVKIEALKNKWIQSQKELRIAASAKPLLEETIDLASEKFKDLLRLHGKNDASTTALMSERYIRK